MMSPTYLYTSSPYGNSKRHILREPVVKWVDDRGDVDPDSVTYKTICGHWGTTERIIRAAWIESVAEDILSAEPCRICEK